MKFTIEKQVDHSITFLDVIISGIDIQNLTLQKDKKLTCAGLVLNFKSLTLFSYKTKLIKCLIDRSFKIYNNWNYFHNDLENIKSNLIENASPPFLICKFIKYYLNRKFSSNQNQLRETSNLYYFTLSHICSLFHHFFNKLLKLCKKICQ